MHGLRALMDLMCKLWQRLARYQCNTSKALLPRDKRSCECVKADLACLCDDQDGLLRLEVRLIMRH